VCPAGGQNLSSGAEPDMWRERNFVERQLGSHVLAVFLQMFCQYRDCDETTALMDVQFVEINGGVVLYKYKKVFVKRIISLFILFRDNQLMQCSYAFMNWWYSLKFMQKIYESFICNYDPKFSLTNRDKIYCKI